MHLAKNTAVPVATLPMHRGEEQYRVVPSKPCLSIKEPTFLCQVVFATLLPISNSIASSRLRMYNYTFRATVGWLAVSLAALRVIRQAIK